MAIAAGSADAEMTRSGVAIFNDYFANIVEAEICHQTIVPGGIGIVPSCKVRQWDELINWGMAVETLNALGFATGAEDVWERVGLRKDACAPTTDDIEKRRRLMLAVLSAESAHGWQEQDKINAASFAEDMRKAFEACHEELPELTRKLKKKRSGKALIPQWLEPSTLLLEHALQAKSEMTIALHLSNLQRIPLQSLCDQTAGITNQPRVLKPEDCRELYTRLSQAQVKIEEALVKFRGGGLLIWAPDNNDQIPRLMNALQKIYTDGGVNVKLQILVPFTPLPGCNTAESILDLWGHPLLHSRYDNLIKEVCFIREASRCVFTRDGTPVHTVKNIAVITAQANLDNSRATIHSMRNMLLEDIHPGEQIFIDAPSGNTNAIWQKLNAMRLLAGPVQIAWKLQTRSRGHTSTHPRSTLTGYTHNVAQVELRALISKIKAEFGGENMIIGRRGMFNDNNTIIAEGSIAQITALCPLVEECVLVSPSKALFTPKASAETFSNVLTESDDLRTLVLRYRKSGPLKGTIFARPKVLPNHLRAERHNAFISRLPLSEASLLKLQVNIEVLGIDGSSHEELPKKIMNKIAAETNTSLLEVHDEIKSLEAGEWRQILREGRWVGRILLQCEATDDLHKVYNIVNGRGVCIDGVARTLEVSSPTNAFLASSLIRSAHPNATGS